jgi:hypothetical protein
VGDEGGAHWIGKGCAPQDGAGGGDGVPVQFAIGFGNVDFDGAPNGLWGWEPNPAGADTGRVMSAQEDGRCRHQFV